MVNTEAEARAAIEAEWNKLCNAEPVAAQPVPKVKALEWKRSFWNQADPDMEHIVDVWEAFGAGHIQGWVEQQKDGKFYTDGQQFDTMEAARDAAQADYDQRIMAAIEPAAIHQDRDAVIEECAKLADAAAEGLKLREGPDKRRDPLNKQIVAIKVFARDIAASLRSLKTGEAK